MRLPCFTSYSIGTARAGHVTQPPIKKSVSLEAGKNGRFVRQNVTLADSSSNKTSDDTNDVTTRAHQSEPIFSWREISIFLKNLTNFLRIQRQINSIFSVKKGISTSQKQNSSGGGWEESARVVRGTQASSRAAAIRMARNRLASGSFFRAPRK